MELPGKPEVKLTPESVPAPLPATVTDNHDGTHTVDFKPRGPAPILAEVRVWLCVAGVVVCGWCGCVWLFVAVCGWCGCVWLVWLCVAGVVVCG